MKPKDYDFCNARINIFLMACKEQYTGRKFDIELTHQQIEETQMFILHQQKVLNKIRDNSISK